MRDEGVTDVGAGAALVIDDDLLTPNPRELFGNDPRVSVCRSSSCDRHDHVHGAIGPGSARAARTSNFGASADAADNAIKLRRVRIATPWQSFLKSTGKSLPVPATKTQPAGAFGCLLIPLFGALLARAARLPQCGDLVAIGGIADIPSGWPK